MKTYLTTSLLILIITFAAGGCATNGTMSTVFSDSGLPKQEYLVGGGWEIKYTAPTKGTVYWAEATTGQILATRSLEEGESFDLETAGNPEEVEGILGIPVSESRPMLFFVPASTDR